MSGHEMNTIVESAAVGPRPAAGADVVDTRRILYYPAAHWTDGNWLKNALLFTHSAVLLCRDQRHTATTILDDELVHYLGSCGLVEFQDPTRLLDGQTTESLARVLTNPAVWDALEPIGAERHFYYGRRVFSTLNGPEPSLEMMEMRNVLMERLGAGDFIPGLDRNHAYPTYRVDGQEPGVPIHIRLWAPLLSTLPQYLKGSSVGTGGELTPLTDHPAAGRALSRLLELPGMPSSGATRVVEPLQAFPDLSSLPWDEALEVGERVAPLCHRFVDQLRCYVLAERDDVDNDGIMELANDVRREVTRHTGPLPFYQLGAIGSSWSSSDAEGALAPLARLLGGGRERAAAWTLVFRSSVSIRC